MERRQGNSLILVLGFGLMLLLFGFMLLHFMGQWGLKGLEEARFRQLRTLVYGVAGDLSAAGEESFTEEETVSLYPGPVQARVRKTGSCSSGGSMQLRSVQAEVSCGDKVVRLQQDIFAPNEALRTRAEQYGLTVAGSISKPNNVKGAPYYAGINFNWPTGGFDPTGFLPLDGAAMEEIRHYGFAGRMYYVKNNLTFSTGTYYGDACIFVDGNVTISTNSKFLGRIVLVVRNGSLTINSGTEMRDVLGLVNGAVTIGGNCQLTGHLRNRMNLTMNGSATFTLKEGAGREFRTGFYN